MKVWRSLSEFAGKPVQSRRDAEAWLKRWIARTGISTAFLQSKTRPGGTWWYVVYSENMARTGIGAFVKDYLEDARRRMTADTHKNTRLYLSRFDEFCRANQLKRLDQVTRRDMERFGATLPDHLSPVSIRRHLEAVRAALNRAMIWDMIRANPAAGVEMPPNRDTTIRRALTDDEIRVIQSDWRTPIREWSMLCLWAGLRRAEATFLAWDDLDLRAGLLAVTAKPDFKFSPKGTRYRDGSPDLIPLVPWLVEVIDPLPRSGRFVFDRGTNRPLKNVDRWYDSVRREAARSGLAPDVTPHAFRHTYCTRLALAGVNRAVLPTLARHLDATTTDRYVHAALEDARRELRKLQPVV